MAYQPHIGNLRDLYSAVVLDTDFRRKLLSDPDEALHGPQLSLTKRQIDGIRRNVAHLAENRQYPAAVDTPSATGADIRLLTLRLAEEQLADNPGPHVALVVMPFAAVRYASIGVSILQEALQEQGIPATVLYLNLDFAESVGYERYDAVGLSSPPTSLVGEWSFQDPELTGGLAGRRYIDEILLDHHNGAFRFADLVRLGEVRSAAEPFLLQAGRDPLWDRFDLVGFTTTFQQNVASLRLARQLRRRRPQLPIVFGGANAEGAMGRALLDQHPWVSAVFQGESEHSFPEFVDHHLRQHKPGDSIRRQVHVGRPVEDMDTLPVPSYRDYLNRKRAGSLPAGFAIPFETSRGCWWGERRHCTFCGLNGSTMAYRSKSTDRAMAELTALVKEAGRPSPANILVVDNILDYRYFDRFLPDLADSDLDARLHFEVKANLTLDQIETLAQAGVVHLQPGIESLNDHVLRLMRKGTTRLRNIQTLKWCREKGIKADWNYLYGFPGESLEQYEDLPALFALIEHLDPPGHVGRARADRFSPFFQEPEELGIQSLDVEPAYYHVYPEIPPDKVVDMAYHFQLRSDGVVPEPEMGLLKRSAEEWRRRHPAAALSARWVDGTIVVDDQRACASSTTNMRFEAEMARALVAIDTTNSVTQVARAVGIENDEARSLLTVLVEAGMALSKGDQFLGLPVLDRPSIPPSWLKEIGRRRLTVSVAST